MNINHGQIVGKLKFGASTKPWAKFVTKNDLAKLGIQLDISGSYSSQYNASQQPTCHDQFLLIPFYLRL